MKQVIEHSYYGVPPAILSNEFIAGLIVGEGSFFWTTNKRKDKRIRIPVFSIGFHIRDFDLVVNIKYSLGLKDRVYEYYHNNRHYVRFLVRDFEGLRKIIINIYPYLAGYKKLQFIEWFKELGKEDVPERYQSLYHIFKNKFPELYI